MADSSGVYRLTCMANMRVYVGSSCRAGARIKQHFAALRRGAHCNTALQSDYNRYGREAFVSETQVVPRDQLVTAEQATLEQVRSAADPYNQAKIVNAACFRRGVRDATATVIINVEMSEAEWKGLKVVCARRGMTMRALALEAIAEWMGCRGEPWG